MAARRRSSSSSTYQLILLLFFIFVVGAAAAAESTELFNVSTVAFEEGYRHLFGGDNLIRSDDDRSVRLVLDRYTGSGFKSSSAYNHGFFSAAIKLPSSYTAGVVVAFYMSNGDDYVDTHDELDFEFLGRIKGQPWRMQTNLYGNGSTHRGREERYTLPFDPSKEAHLYSIFWSDNTIIFYVDETPIREVRKSDWMGADFPSKPMWVYATIWDGSTWATANGRYGVSYKYSPFVSDFSRLALRGCRTSDVSAGQRCADVEAEIAAPARYAVMSPRQRVAMRSFRERYMIYSFCHDLMRYPITFPDCEVVPSERQRFQPNGDILPSLLPVRRRARRRTRTAGAAKTMASSSSSSDVDTLLLSMHDRPVTVD